MEHSDRYAFSNTTRQVFYLARLLEQFMTGGYIFVTRSLASNAVNGWGA